MNEDKELDRAWIITGTVDNDITADTIATLCRVINHNAHVTNSLLARVKELERKESNHEPSTIPKEGSIRRRKTYLS